MYSLKILISQPLRLALTIFGVGLCIVLMIFLLSVYKGVEYGSMEYIRYNKTDLWILQKNSWNIMRTNSFLPENIGDRISEIDGVKQVSPICILLSGVSRDKPIASIYMFGYDPNENIGGPPILLKGRNVKNMDDIVIDKAFAKKFNYEVRDSICINEDTLFVCGISDGSNALVIQYAFVLKEKIQSMVGFPGFVSAFLVKTDSGDASRISREIHEEYSNVEVFDHATFLENNHKEMETGFLPLIFTIALISMVVLTAILCLLLSINILEKRKEIAIIKTLGSPRSYLPRMVIEQSLIIFFASSIAALAAFYPLVLIVEALSPEVTILFSIDNFLLIVLVGSLMSLISSLISIRRLRSIYTMEVFS